MKRLISLVAVLALLALVAYRIAAVRKADSAVVEKPADSALVRTAKVVRADLSEKVALTGSVRPRNEVDVFTKVPGRLESVSAQVGDKVRAGQVLASVEHREIGWQEKAAAAQQRAAEAGLEVAKAGLAGAQLELDRTKALHEGGAAPQAALDGAGVRLQLSKAQVAAAEAQVAQASAAAGLARQQLQNAQIEAPVSGTVTRRTAQVGNMVGPQQPVFTIQDVATLKLETSVDALTYSRLSRGARVELTVDAFADEVFRGRIDVLSPTLDPINRRANVEVLIDNTSGRLMPNMFARAKVEVGKLPKSLVIPREAVLEAPGGALVYRVKQGVAQAVKPLLGPVEGHLVAVLEGLAEGDEVVLSGLGALSDGAPVRVSPAVSVSQAR